MQSSTFTTRLIAKGKVTVPEATRKLLGINQGDIVEITITKRIPEPVQVGDIIGKKPTELDKQN